MIFDETRVFTAVNADKVEVGSKVIVSDNFADLKSTVAMDCTPTVITGINPSSFKDRFVTGVGTYSLCYVIEPKSGLKWFDLRIGDILCTGGNVTEMVVGIDIDPEPDEEDGLLYHICLASGWTSDEDLKDFRRVK